MKPQDLFSELRDAVAAHDECLQVDTRSRLIVAARQFVRAVDTQAMMIEQIRQHVTPTEQALNNILAQGLDP